MCGFIPPLSNALTLNYCRPAPSPTSHHDSNSLPISKTPRKPGKILVCSWRPSPATKGRQVQHHPSPATSLRHPTVRGKAPFNYARLIPWKPTKENAQCPSRVLNLSVPLETDFSWLVKGWQIVCSWIWKEKKPQNWSCWLFPPCVLSFKSVFCWFLTPVPNINNRYLLLENESSAKIEWVYVERTRLSWGTKAVQYIGYKHKVWSQTPWVQISAAPFTMSGTLGKLFRLCLHFFNCKIQVLIMVWI